jgi:glycosyltransferase involved in cell wall biosynthesis
MESVLAQKHAPAYELIVVDNNSSDGTAAIVHRYVERGFPVRYVFERKQGVSYGRNAGIAAADAPFIAFTDDDVTVAEDWLAAICQAFEEHTDCGFVGGKVLPHWPVTPPEWLTQKHWGPLALLDYGMAQVIDANNRKCLITANMAARRGVLKTIGYFRPAFQKTAGSTCSIEDRELQERYWRSGGRCWFDPRIVVHAEVQRFRLERRYHRKWHFSHGELNALLHDEEFESSGQRFLKIPGHVWRRLIEHSAASVLARLRLRRESAFEHELEALFFAGFVRMRLGEKTQPG